MPVCQRVATGFCGSECVECGEARRPLGDSSRDAHIVRDLPTVWLALPRPAQSLLAQAARSSGNGRSGSARAACRPVTLPEPDLSTAHFLGAIAGGGRSPRPGDFARSEGSGADRPTPGWTTGRRAVAANRHVGQRRHSPAANQAVGFKAGA
jgi:hypothetical protein